MHRLLFLAGLTLIAGCRANSMTPPGVGASPGPLPPPISAPAPAPSATDAKPAASVLVFEASANAKTLRRGQTLTILMKISNSGKATQTLEFTSGQRFDLQAWRVQNGVVSKDASWTWSMDKMFIQSLSSVEVRPGQALEFTATWDGTTGEALPRGEYEISAYLTATPQLIAPPFRVTLE